MTNPNDPEQAAPRDWLTLIDDHCDLDVAFEALEGWNHFHSDTYRGRLRSLQLRPREAWAFFDLAEARYAQFKETPRNRLRRYFLKIYSFENALIEQSDPAISFSVSVLERRIREIENLEPVESPVAASLGDVCRGLLALHRADYILASRIFESLIRASGDRKTDEKTGFYFAAAASSRARGEEAEARRHMEDACLYIPALESKFNMGYFAAIASAICRLWDREEEAKEWSEFLHRIEIPEKTIGIFSERGKRIFERSRSLERVFLF